MNIHGQAAESDPARYALAVSGGVDSVVLLHKFWLKHNPEQLVVAHFDHGIRPDSAADARFVEALAASYGLRYEGRREELGVNASEAVARERRYLFLRHVAKKHQARIVTAHHGDDLVESISINLIRGTGWRGLAVLGDPAIDRPLLRLRKTDVYEYALDNQLEWVEDETNQTDLYLRNQLRRALAHLPPKDRIRLTELQSSQQRLKEVIDQLVEGLLASVDPTSRHLYIMLPSDVADEVLRRHLNLRVGTPLTRPQRGRLLIAIKTMPAGRIYEAGEGVNLRFGTKRFTVEKSTPVLS